jgi:hypothetical protein
VVRQHLGHAGPPVRACLTAHRPGQHRCLGAAPPPGTLRDGSPCGSAFTTVPVDEAHPPIALAVMSSATEPQCHAAHPPSIPDLGACPRAHGYSVTMAEDATGRHASSKENPRALTWRFWRNTRFLVFVAMLGAMFLVQQDERLARANVSDAIFLLGMYFIVGRARINHFVASGLVALQIIVFQDMPILALWGILVDAAVVASILLGMEVPGSLGSFIRSEELDELAIWWGAVSVAYLVATLPRRLARSDNAALTGYGKKLGESHEALRGMGVSPALALLIACGVFAVSDNAVAYVVGVPFFLILWHQAITRSGRSAIFSQVGSSGLYAALVYALVVMSLAVTFFTVLTWVLAEADLIEFHPSGNPSRIALAEFFLWHIADAVPAAEVPEPSGGGNLLRTKGTRQESWCSCSNSHSSFP